MATIDYVPFNPGGSSAGIGGWTWSSLGNGDDGSPLRIDRRTDRSVQVDGTFGVGGTLVIEGSNDGVSYYTLNDLQGVQLSLTSAVLEGVSETPVFLRPRVTGGDGTTSLNVRLVAVGRPA